MSKKNASSSAENQDSSILITGSAGFIGTSLLRRLADSGRPLTALYRAHLPEPRAQAKPLFADLMRKENLDTGFQKIRTVVHLAWNESFVSESEDSQWQPDQVLSASRNLEMLKNLIHAMEFNGCRRLIFLSPLGASRHAETLFLREKYQAEALILNSKIPEKIILRSSINFSEIATKDRLVSAIASLMRFPWIYPVPMAKTKIAPIHVQDTTAIIGKLIDLPLTVSAQILEVAGQHEIAVEEAFRLVSQGLGKGTHLPIKGFLGRALTPLFERFQKDAKPLGPNIRELLALNNTLDEATTINSPIRQRLPDGGRRFQDAMQEKKLIHK